MSSGLFPFSLLRLPLFLFRSVVVVRCFDNESSHSVLDPVQYRGRLSELVAGEPKETGCNLDSSPVRNDARGASRSKNDKPYGPFYF